MSEKIKIVLMGYQGQLGHDILKQFGSDSIYKIILIDREECDLNNFKSIASTLEKQLPFKYLINCSAVTDTSFCEQNIDICFNINSFSIFEISKFCQKFDITLFQLSTDYVFSGDKHSPYIETDPTKPINIYGQSKLLSEQFIQNYMKKYFIFRVSSLFGIAGAKGKPSENANFIEALITKVKKGEPLKVINDQFTCPTHTLDVAKAIKHFIDNNISEYGIYHATNSNFCSWYEYANEIFRILKNHKAVITPISFTEFPSIIKRPVFSALNNEKLNKHYKMPTWEYSVKEYLNLKNYI